MTNEESIGAIWTSLNKKDSLNIHEGMGIAAENLVKSSLLSRSFDNVTVIVVGFSNLEASYNHMKKMIPKSPLKPGLTLSLSNKDMLAFPSNSHTPLYSLSTLAKNSQRNLTSLSGADYQNIFKKETQSIEPSSGIPGLEKKDDVGSGEQSASKGYLPNIKAVKHISTFQSNHK